MAGTAGRHAQQLCSQVLPAACSVLRGRFDAAESQLGDGGADADADVDGGAGACQLSFFQMADRLSRMDAAKLFYQILGELQRRRQRR